MASVIGKWKLDSCENFEEYMKAIGVSDEKRADAHKYLSTGSNFTQEFTADDDNWTLTTCTDVGERTFSFTIGNESDSMTLDDRKITIMFTIDGDSLIENQKGDDFECTHVRKGAGNTNYDSDRWMSDLYKEVLKSVTKFQKCQYTSNSIISFQYPIHVVQ